MPSTDAPAPWGVVSANMRFKMFSLSSLPGGVCPEVVVYTSRDYSIEFDSLNGLINTAGPFSPIESESKIKFEDDDFHDLIFPMGLLCGAHLR